MMLMLEAKGEAFGVLSISRVMDLSPFRNV